NLVRLTRAPDCLVLRRVRRSSLRTNYPDRQRVSHPYPANKVTSPISPHEARDAQPRTVLDNFRPFPSVNTGRMAQPMSHLPHAGVVMQATLGRLAGVMPHGMAARLIVAMTLVTMWSQPASAQRRNLAGIVRDSAGAPIPDADVRIPSAHLLTRTDNAGAFLLPRVDPGQTELSIRRLGYAP